jgi:hypothetical protein
MPYSIRSLLFPEDGHVLWPKRVRGVNNKYFATGLHVLLFFFFLFVGGGI